MNALGLLSGLLAIGLFVSLVVDAAHVAPFAIPVLLLVWMGAAAGR